MTTQPETRYQIWPPQAPSLARRTAAWTRAIRRAGGCLPREHRTHTVTRTSPIATYSYRSATTGSIRDARRAGK